LTGWGVFYAFTLVVWYGVIPALDVLFGNDPNNPPEAAVARLEADRYYRILTYLTVPVHYASLIVSAWWVATQPMAWWEVIVLALSLGIVNGMAKVVLAVVGYGHFFIEHNKGHHRDVATPEDPATSRMGESIYKFSLREIPGAFRRAWNLEKVRLERVGKSEWSLSNEIIPPLLLSVVIYTTLILVLGPDPKLLVFLPIQIAFGWWQLTSANYIEHYGLLREKMADGRYERAQPRHSWNSNHIASNLILFHLQRHSDHHAHPTRSYQSLRAFKDLPELPTGYPGMFFMAMIPPVFRSVMDRRVVEWAGGDLAKIQIDPARRKQIIRKFGASRQSARIAAE
jgi:alkane 1-monooxygenase